MDGNGAEEGDRQEKLTLYHRVYPVAFFRNINAGLSFVRSFSPFMWLKVMNWFSKRRHVQPFLFVNWKNLCQIGRRDMDFRFENVTTLVCYVYT